MKFTGFNEDDLKSLKRAFSDKPSYQTSTGFTGNKKTKQEKANMKVGQKRRRTAHLTNKERKKLTELHKQVDSMFIAASYITPKSEDKTTKKDMKKGKNVSP